MLAVHAFWSAGSGLCLWAEDSDRAVKSPSQALRSARPHPFAAPAEVLGGLHPGKYDTAVLRLPSLRSAPLDSPELVRVMPRPAPSSEAALLAWTVPIVRLDVSSEVALSDERVPGVRYGASVDFLGELAGYARDLVERGRVLPALADAGDGPRAYWRPVLRGLDITALNSLTVSMPPVCRAAFAETLDEPDPHELVLSELLVMVDALARRQLPADLDLLPARRGRAPKRLPAVEAWLAALTGPDGRFDADPAQVRVLAAGLVEWDEVGTGAVGPAHATFRLSDAQGSPDAGDGEHSDPVRAESWRLEFLLQSSADPSLLVPAAQAWDDDGSLSRWIARPQEVLLGELGRASRVYPELAQGLRVARPSGLELDAHGAFRFLSTAAPMLDDAGFGVLLPAWWNGRRKLGLALSVSTPVDGVVSKQGAFGREQLADFSWQLAVGDDVLTEQEIAALVAAKAPLVRMRGEWVAVDPEQLRRGLEFLQRARSGRKSVGEILALAAAHPDDLDLPLEVSGVRADGWLGDLLAGTAAQSLRPVDPPAGFSATLRPYQRRGLSWLAFLSSLGLGSCLADDMGLGKTVQLLALEAVERGIRKRGRRKDAQPYPTLLICPMSLVGNWQREAAKFVPGLRVYAHHGRERLAGEKLAEHLADIDVVVTTYATATRDLDELAEYHWRRVVLDEAQAVKNSLSRAAKAVREFEAEHRVALTGTPVENRLAEMWSIMDFLNPGVLGSPERFRTRFAIPVERHGQTEPADRLRAITRPYILRRVKTDPAIIDDLPEKIEIKQYCKLTAEQSSLYRTVVDDMMERIEGSDGIARRGNVLAAMAKLKQVCNHPAHLLHDRTVIGQRSGKITRLEEILEEILAEGDRVLCFTQFTEFAEMLVPHVAARFGVDVAYLHGGTPKKRRDEMVARFQSGDGPPIFVLSLKAGGTGLTLTAANHVIHLDRWWNPAVENQATDRAFRIGQQRNVAVHKFICIGTLEEKIDTMIEEKQALADLVVGDGEGWLTELSTDDLRSVFALSTEATDD